MITFTFLSLVTSVKDYVEITHKLIEIEPLKNYTEFGALFTYFIFSFGDFLKNFFSFSLFKNIWSIPIIIPDIASSMISEVSVLDGYFHNAFTFLDDLDKTNNIYLVFFEKFIIGLINSLFLFLPTSTSHLITLRRFVMQGLEAGYMAGLGTVAGNFLWLASIILGWRFFVIPWLSLDIFRYVLGFILLVKYIWDSSKERRMALEDLSKWKIFLLNFLLALTEQSCIYPFISNLSISTDASILEGFPVENYLAFLGVHGAYLLGILLGSFSLLQFTCWFWENPAFSIYLWITTKYNLVKISSNNYYKILNFTFLYGTMLCAIASIPYYGLDYTLTNPIGLVPQDRIIDQKKSQLDPEKLLTETAFLGVNSTDKNSRIKDGVHARRERWKQRLIKYQAYDASIYDQGVYDFLTIEDLNYGFDRFWLRRKTRNHQIRFRLFPGPWMRSLKKQLNNPALRLQSNRSLEQDKNSEGFKASKNDTVMLEKQNAKKAASGPRVEFFRVLFEQFYHPNFHDRNKIKNAYIKNNKTVNNVERSLVKDVVRLNLINNNKNTKNLLLKTKVLMKPGLIYTNSALRKFVRNINSRMDLKQLKNASEKKTYKLWPSPLRHAKDYTSMLPLPLVQVVSSNRDVKMDTNLIYSKRWKSIFSKIEPYTKTSNRKSYRLFRNVSKNILLTPAFGPDNFPVLHKQKSVKSSQFSSLQKLSTKERKILDLRTKSNNYKNTNTFKSLSLSGPLNIYLQKEQAFKRKLRYYGTTSLRKLTVGNQAPYFKALMKRGFYYYKPSLRWKKTLYVASMRRGLRKKSRKQRVLIMPNGNPGAKAPATPLGVENIQNIPYGLKPIPGGYPNVYKDSLLKVPTHSYTVLGKHASRYRHQIYKDVLQHWYYTPFNRLLLKFDVDAFMNRQPKSHFLTKNEERLLHIRRFLLSEHYDTLRWYTKIRHYRTMKTTIGGTKSFASRSYNQQFQGTFKKIRHLFAITPKQGDLYTLKFDQPLYNDNKLKDNVYYHEELSAPRRNTWAKRPKDIPGGYVGNNVDQTRPVPVFNSKNAKQSAAFVPLLDAGENVDLINESSFLIGNQHMLLPPGLPEGKEAPRPAFTLSNSKILTSAEAHLPVPSPKGALTAATPLGVTGLQENNNFVYSELYIKLLKESKKRIYNQTFLKNYITHRIEKREKLQDDQRKEVEQRVKELNIWLSFVPAKTKDPTDTTKTTDKEQKMLQNNSILTTGMHKAINDSINLSLGLNVVEAQRDEDEKNPGALAPEKNPDKKLKYTFNVLNNAYTRHSKDQILNKLTVINLLTSNLVFSKTQGKARANMIDKDQGSTISFSQAEPLARLSPAQVKTTLEKTKILFQKTIHSFKHKTDFTKILQLRTDKNLEWWRKKQRVILNRKKARKRDRFKKLDKIVVNKKNKKVFSNINIKQNNTNNYSKVLYGNYDIADYLLPNINIIDNNALIKKQDRDLANTLQSQSLDLFVPQLPLTSRSSKMKKVTNIWHGFFSKKLRKKGSSQSHRYRSLPFSSSPRYQTATRKARLLALDNYTKMDKTSNDKGLLVDNLSQSKKEQQERLKLKTEELDKLEKNGNYYFKKIIEDKTIILKKSQIKKRSRHSWKKRARHLFNTNYNKYRKRRLRGNGKLRVMNKKLKKYKKTNELRSFWWTSFLPRYLNDLNKNSKLSPQSNKIFTHFDVAKINIAFKPLSNNGKEYPNSQGANLNKIFNNNLSIRREDSQESHKKANPAFLKQSTTSSPFYAGWDESLRKFIVTNRLLSRRDSGLVRQKTTPGAKAPVTPKGVEEPSLVLLENKGQKQNAPSLFFTNAPIQGLNEGSFLYWLSDMPFNSYNIDQFITINQSFYAPLGWRRFEYRHSILKTWANHSKISPGAKAPVTPKGVDHKTLIISMKNHIKLLKTKQKTEDERFDFVSGSRFDMEQKKQDEINTKKAVARRIKKRYKLLKQMPNILMYSPTGPLLTEVLPSHYLSVFDQQYRFPRNRYLKRNTLKTMKDTTLLAMEDSAPQQLIRKNALVNNSFTLRKRVKPRRKYHRKRFIKKEGLIFPRRTKFNKLLKEHEDRWRPSSRSKQKRKETLLSSYLDAKKQSNKRVKTNPLRLRQLRRREFQQILKPSQRYIPRNGGFAWPGDYLRLEFVSMPKLKNNQNKKTTLKQKMNAQPVGIMPRKYLIEKHNIKVLKKKLEKAYSSHQLSKVIKEYKI
uniref:Ycf1 n=1 Tax=Tetrabaena socialis TaxID=47790 RepID=A0A1B1FKB7_9CHLO|nr:Ycf1 [Tetrabaena socialis]